jgi:hypothetical protein
MLFPDERIGGYRVKLGKVLGAKGAEREELTLQNGLIVKGHA